jgi:hypothetical protein
MILCTSLVVTTKLSNSKWLQRETKCPEILCVSRRKSGDVAVLPGEHLMLRQRYQENIWCCDRVTMGTSGVVAVLPGKHLCCGRVKLKILT